MSITAIIGLLGGAMPAAMEYFNRRQDNAQELKILELQQKGRVADTQARMDMSILQADSASYSEAHKSARSAGEHKTSTWLGRVLFDLVAVWRAAVRPWIVTMLVCFYTYTKYVLIHDQGMSVIHVWGAQDWALLELGVSFYLGNRGMDKMARKA